MRDNSGIDDLTKVNTETEFQPEDTFKRRSKCAKIFGRVGNIFMFLSTSSSYKSYIQSQLPDFVDGAIASVGKFIFSYEQVKTWDEWADYFEEKDLNTLSFREQGIFFILCVRIQRSLLYEISDPSFSWDEINLEEKTFYISYASELQEYLYEDSQRSLYKRIAHDFVVLLLCGNLWMNVFEIINYYDDMCFNYVQIVLKSLKSEAWQNEILEETRQSRVNNYRDLPKYANAQELMSSLLADEE
jgi:hypothetical protein